MINENEVNLCASILAQYCKEHYNDCDSCRFLSFCESGESVHYIAIPISEVETENKPAIIRNIDYIRNLSDDGLAKFLTESAAPGCSGYCGACVYYTKKEVAYADCIDCVKSFLNERITRYEQEGNKNG